MSETSVMNKIQIAVSKIGARLFRNQVGKYKLKDGTYISSGLCVGSSDLIGYHTVMVTPDMIGQRLAIFTAIEVKTRKGKLTDQQKHFIDIVRNAGGRAFVARSIEDAINKLLEGGHLAKGTGF